jgi:DNA-binding NarL/FixJ family response regulator
LTEAHVMADETSRRKEFLFIDDDAGFLTGVGELFSAMSQGAWEIATAQNHAQALEHLSRQSVDVVVLDIGMPVMDGIEFLRLLGRTHPGQQVVMLTARTGEENRKTCLEQGAALFLQKPVTQEGFRAVFAALDALAAATPQVGFRGMMRRVGLPEVLQMECLGRKSSVLEVFTGTVRGRIFILEGSIVHAESGTLQGEVALYGLLGLRGGEFNLLPFAEPSQRTIAGHYEFLLMEAARLTDEGTTFFQAPPAEAAPVEALSTQLPELNAAAAPPVSPPTFRIEELLLCSGAGEVLFERGCPSLERRLTLLGQIEQQAAQLSNMVPAGRFDRLEILTADGRMVCQVQPHMRLLVRRGTPQPTGV